MIYQACLFDCRYMGYEFIKSYEKIAKIIPLIASLDYTPYDPIVLENFIINSGLMETTSSRATTTSKLLLLLTRPMAPQYSTIYVNYGLANFSIRCYFRLKNFIVFFIFSLSLNDYYLFNTLIYH